MKNEEQNQFYSSISKYYSEIFPFNPTQLLFVKDEVGDLQGKKILDIGCAVGELAFQLAKSGAIVTGIDLNADLLAQAKKKGSQPNLNFQMGNMLELENDFQPGCFDAVLCFGNTLVHLQEPDEMQKMIRSVYSVLREGGHFLLQILNYAHILKNNISELPLIETDKVRFVRKYKFSENSRLIQFNTDLLKKETGTVTSNQTTLYALKSRELHVLLQSGGFQNIRSYANFKMDDFGGRHLPLVVSCVK